MDYFRLINAIKTSITLREAENCIEGKGFPLQKRLILPGSKGNCELHNLVHS